MMEVNEGLEGEVALSSRLSFYKNVSVYSSQLQRYQPTLTGLRIVFRDLHAHHTFPPKILNLMH